MLCFCFVGGSKSYAQEELSLLAIYLAQVCCGNIILQANAYRIISLTEQNKEIAYPKQLQTLLS